MGVDIFIFLSAVGLFYPMSKNSIKDFYLHRFSRVFITWLVIMVPVFIYEDFIFSKVSVLDFFLDVTTLRYWVDHANTNTTWFVPFIIALYIMSPLLYKADIRTKHISTVFILVLSIVFNVISSSFPNQMVINYSFCFSRLPIFLFGLLVSGTVKKRQRGQIELFDFRNRCPVYCLYNMVLS